MSYAFDGIGNRLSSMENSQSRTYVSNALNQYSSITNPAVSQTYDDDGNMLSDGEWSFAWDAENRLISAAKGTTVLAFKYDAQSRRIEKTVTEAGTVVARIHFVYKGFKLIQELDALNGDAPIREYFWSENDAELDVPLAVHDAAANAYRFFHCDANKNVTDATDSSGAVLAHYEYAPFGALTAATGSFAAANPFRFSSEFFDAETGLVYYNYRYYSPSLGRWLSRDPIGENASLNAYAYLRNESIANNDDLGLHKCEIHIALGHGALNKDGTVSADSDIGSYAQEFAGDFPDQCAAVAIIGCWTKQTMKAVDAKRRAMNQKPVNWVYPANSDIPNQRRYTPRFTGDERVVGPDEDPDYVMKTKDQVERDTMMAALKKANEICKDKKKCCKEVRIMEVVLEKKTWYRKARRKVTLKRRVQCE